MFDISFTEIVVIGIVALIVLGPERLPVVARTLGHLLGRGQRYVSQIKNDIKQEIELDELRKLKTSLEETSHAIHDSVQKEIAGLQAVQKEVATLTTGTTPVSHTDHAGNIPGTTESAPKPAANNSSRNIPDRSTLQLDLGLEDTTGK